MVFIPIIVGFIIEQFVKKYEWWEHHEDSIDDDDDDNLGDGHSSDGVAQNMLLVPGEVKDGENPEGRRERAMSRIKPGHMVLASQPMSDGRRSIFVHVKKNEPSMDGAPSGDTDIFNVSADIAAEQAAEQAAENEALKGRIEFLEETITKSQTVLTEARKKERRMQRQIDTLKSELKKRMTKA